MIGFYLTKKDLKIKNSRKYLNNISPNITNASKHLFVSAKEKNSGYYFEESDIFIFFKGIFINEEYLLKLVKKDSISNKANLIFLLYSKRDEEFIHNIDGFFSIIIYDSKKDKVFLFNDHIGSETVYIHSDSDVFHFSSDLKELTEKCCIKKIDKDRVLSFFKYIHSKNNETFYKNVSQIMGGQYAVIENGKCSIKDYISYDLEKYNNLRSIDEFAEKYREIFFRSVSSCMETNDDKVGFALSGGLDSSAITCVGAKIKRDKVTTFSAIFSSLDGHDKLKTDESNYSSDVIEKYNLNHADVDIAFYGPISSLIKKEHDFIEPDLLINGYIHENIFDELKRKKISIYLDGYGGDSILSHGYNLLHEYGKKWNFFGLFQELKFLYKRNRLKTPILKSLKTYVFSNMLPDYIHWLFKSNFSKKPQQFIWAKRLAGKKHNKNIFQNLKNVYGFYPLKFQKSAKFIHLNDVKSKIIGLSVRSIRDRARLKGIDIRFPFLSKDLIELSLCTPEKYKLRKGVNRFIFRHSLKNILPDSVYQRVSKSDLSPISQKEISNINFNEIEKLIHNFCPKLFDIRFLESLHKHREEYIFEVYQIFSFLKWLEQRGLKL